MPNASPSPLQQQNKALVQAYLENIANRGDEAAVPRYFAPDVLFNGQRDLRPLLMRRQALRRAFPDLNLVIEDQIAEGDKVVTRVTFRGTHRGEFAGVAPTGRSVAYGGIAIDRLADGKIVEMWHVANTASLLEQIGAAAPSR